MMDDTSYQLIHVVNKVREGKLESVRDFISSSGLPYSQAWSKEGYVLLREAVKYKQKYIAKLLLAYDAKVNSESTENSNTPLHFAVLNGDIEIVEMLLDRDANVNAKGRQNIIHDDVMENGEGYTPLHLAVTEGREAIIKLLLNRGANVNVKGKGGITSLHIATGIIFEKKWEKYLQTVERLLNHGACVDSEYISSSRYWLGNTPLHFAIQLGWRETVELLLSRGAKVNARTQSGLTALHIAINKGHKELVEILLECGAEINFMTHTAPLHRAAGNGYSEIVEVLLKFGADAESKDKDGRTALHIAVMFSRVETVKVLLKFGADVDSKDNCGRTALSFASNSNFIEIIEMLLKFGADIDSKDKFGKTKLHYACNHGYSSFVTTLLEHGCDINVTCNNNQTPLDLALTYNYWDSNDIKILKRHIIKMKTANLYVSRKNLLSINSDDEIYYKGFQNECEKEIASMKCEKVNNVNVSFYDVLTEDINQLEMYAGNESIGQVLKSDDYKIKFPIYASMINSNFRKGERKRELLEESNKIFYIFRYNFGLPRECTEEIFSYLSEKDFRVLCRNILRK